MFSFFRSHKDVINVRKERDIISNLMLGIASISFFAMVSQILVYYILALFVPVDGSSTTFQMALNAFTMYGIAMPLSLVFFKRCPVVPTRKNKLGLFMLLGLIAVCFALTYVGSILGSVIGDWLAGMMNKSAYDPVESTVTRISLGAVFLFMVVLAPIFEEIFYRRVVIDRLRRYGDIPAIIISGLMFGLIHGNFSQFFYAAFLGMVFGAVYVYTGKLRYTIFLHMLINFMGSFYFSLMAEKFGGQIPAEITEEIAAQFPVGYTMMSAYSIVYTISFVFALPALALFLDKLRPQKGQVILQGTDRLRAVLCNAGLWVSLLFLAGFFALNTFSF